MKVRYRASVVAELKEIHDWIARDSLDRANDVTARIVRAIDETLAVHPLIGRKIGNGEIRRWPIRGLPYLVIYRVDAQRGCVVIMGVLHGARDRSWD